ncbi:MAG TPA: NADH-quinone oxidoreductase subunit NuoE [Vicinamibacterales bacterium]|nr:NADH-quinone oxidoreductase subunit NuoE [Vicinamibacterales bacterium]
MSFHPQMEYAPARWHRSERRLAEAGEPFRYTPENQAKFDELVTHYPPEQRKSAIIYALFLVQQQQGYVSGQSMAFVAQQIGCTAADVEDVVSYYTMFYTKPVGRIVINVCRTLSCALLGAERVTEEISAKLGIVPGQTTADGMFTLMEVECLGACDRAPVVMINDDQWHERLQPSEVGRFLEDLRTKGPNAVSGCHLCVETK